MEFQANIEEALRAKEIAEKRFAEKDFMGAKNYAVKAKTLCPGLDGISQMVATFDVYVASENKVNGAIDYYSILGLKPSADKDAVKRQYKQMAVLLHPDKNKTVGSDGAFKLLSEALTKLSDGAKTGSYGRKRKKQMTSAVVQTNFSDLPNAGVTGYSNSNLSSPNSRLDTFWTVCTSCKVQYEYLRKYVNKRLSCKNCRGVFIAVETGTAPVSGAFPYTPWPYSSNGHGRPIHDGVAYVPTNAAYFPRNGFSGYHSGHGHEYASNISFEWNYTTNSTSVVGHNGQSNIPADAIYQANGKIDTAQVKLRSRSNGRQTTAYMGSNMRTVCDGSSELRTHRPDKRRKVVAGAASGIGLDKREHKNATEATATNGNVSDDVKHPVQSVIPARRWSNAPAFDMRKLFIDKAKTDINKKLAEMKLASEAAAVTNKEILKVNAVWGQNDFDKDRACHKLDPAFGSQIEKIKGKSIPITVPDSDFHDFDKDRAEECFKPKQIWALYDEDDGMPRLYCLIREVISINPFKIHINYLNSKTDSEFGTVNWLDSGFTKSCGHFRAWNPDVVDQVNIFSHNLGKEKAGRGGCVRIFPRSGDIWAMYRNWSPDWDRSTPDEIRHQYEMVEVLGDYSEVFGTFVTPLSKVAGFKTVYQRNTDRDAVRKIPRREMVRFSHQVPSWLLKGEASNLPDGCWDLDPAAIPEELLNSEADG